MPFTQSSRAENFVSGGVFMEQKVKSWLLSDNDLIFLISLSDIYQIDPLAYLSFLFEY